MFSHKIVFIEKPVNPCENCTESSCCACSGSEPSSPAGSVYDVDCD